MLTLLKIRNIALIDELEIEFGPGLDLLTGETGSGKSIIVDSLGALIGDRLPSDIIRQGQTSARIEGAFTIYDPASLADLFSDAGLETADDEIIVRREISLEGRNRVFVNNQLVTLGFLRRLGAALADIHGQGEQTSLYDVSTHVEILDDFAAAGHARSRVAEAFHKVAKVRTELDELRQDESEKLQLADILRFQVDEIGQSGLTIAEELELEDEKRRLNNIEKISSMTSEAHSLLYDDENSTLATLDRAATLIANLAEYDARFRGFDENLETARSTISELGSMARDLGSSLEFSPERLDQIENRLAEIARLKRKYGGSVEAVLSHFEDARERLNNIETAEFREQELERELDEATADYRIAASELHATRVKAAAEFSLRVEADLRQVALDSAKFQVRISESDDIRIKGSDTVEFYFSANAGEPPRPLARIASGGEASRLMLILKTASKTHDRGKTAVFDEIDVGIGGRVAEAVGRKLKALSTTHQVFCVTHQPQIASLADRHFVVAKTSHNGATSVEVRELSTSERIEELARMLAGERVTDEARENARAMLAAAN